MTTTLTAVGLTLALAGAIALIAWRHGRSRARIPAMILAAAVLILASPPLLEVLTDLVDMPPHDAAQPPHPDDAVVQPEDIERR